MDQGHPVAATTDARRFPRALRPLLLLGGFVVLWWCLATGTAQAADEPDHGLSSTTASLTKTVDKVVHPKAHRPAKAHRTAPKPTPTVRQHVAPVTKAVTKTVTKTVDAVRTTVEKTPAAPVVKTTVKTVQTVVEPVVEKATKALDVTPAGPVVTPVVEGLPVVGDHAPSVVESSTLQGETATKHPSTNLSSKAPSGIATGTSELAPTSTSAVAQQPAHVEPSSPLDAPVTPGHDDRALTTTGSSAASSVQSGAGAGPGAGLCETGHLFVPGTTGTVVSGSADRLDAGPAYRPSCSPD